MRLGVLLLTVGLVGACGSKGAGTGGGCPFANVMTFSTVRYNPDGGHSLCPGDTGPATRHGVYWDQGKPSTQCEDCSRVLPDDGGFSSETCIVYPDCMSIDNVPSHYVECVVSKNPCPY